MSNDTEKPRLVQELLNSEERLLLAQKAAGMEMFDLDMVNNLQEYSEGFFGLFGLEPFDHVESEDTWLRMVHPEDRERVEVEFRKSLASGALFDTEYRVVWPDRSVKWISSKAKVFLDDDRNPTRMIGALSDITDRKRIEVEKQQRIERILRQRVAIGRLVSGDAITAGSVRVGLQLVTEEVSSALRAGRVTVWRLPQHGEDLYCIEQYEAGEHKPSSGMALSIENHPRYWRALCSASWINVDDAQTDARTSELSEHYLVPRGIRSMLAVGIRIGAELQGVLCVEHTGEERSWYYDEQTFAGSSAEVVAQIFAMAERRHAEELLQQKDSIIESASSAICTSDIAGNMIYANPTFLVMWGFDHSDDSMGAHRTIFSLMNDQLDDAMNALQNAGKWRGEKQARRIDGSVFDVQISAAVVRDKQGNSTSFVFSCEDISERKQAQQAVRALLEASSGQYGHAFFESTVQGLADTLQANCTVIGALREQGDKCIVETIAVNLDGKPAPNFSYNLAGTPCANVIDKELCAYESGVAGLFPDDALLADLGIEAYVGTPLRGTDGTSLGVMFALYRASLVDARFAESILQVFAVRVASEMEREKAEQALHREKAFTDAALDAQVDTFFLFDPATQKALQWNRAFREISGYTDEEIARLPAPSSYYGPEDLEKAGILIQQMQKDGTGILEMELLCKDGRKIPTEYTASFIQDQRAARDCIVAVGRDITDRRRNEEMLATRLRFAEHWAEGDIDELMRMFLDEIERLTHSQIGFFHFLEDDQVTLSLQMWSTNTVAKMCEVKTEKSHYPVEQAGVWVDCMREGQSVVHNDYNNLPHRKGLPEGHAPVVRELVVPVYSGNKIKAILGVGNKLSDYTENDVAMVQQLADLALNIIVRRRTEIELQQSEARLRAVTEALPDLIYLIDEDGRYVEAIASGLNILPGRLISEFFSEEDTQRFMNAIQDTIRTEENQTIEYAVDLWGSQHWFEGRMVPLPRKIGEKRVVVLVAQDNTERRAAEEALLEERDRAQRYLDMAGTVIMALDRDGTVTLINKKGCEILRDEPDEIVGKNWFQDYLQEKERENVRDMFSKAMAGESELPEFYENSVLCRDGLERIIAWTNTTITSEAGAIIGTLSSGEDITERKNAERELKKHREHLEELVEERTRELQVRTNELERFNMAMVGRENRVIELKQKINKLSEELGRAAPYMSWKSEERDA